MVAQRIGARERPSMANTRHSEPNREAMLRRVAIVLSSLPTDVASGLLGSIDPKTKQAVRRTMHSLEDVDPLERRRALRAFRVLLQERPSENSTGAAQLGQDEAVIGDSAAADQPKSRVVSSATGERHDSESDSSPLAFLGDVDDDTLVGLLAAERAQTIALVLASIAPPQAARVLPRLSPQVQSDALSRIGRLDDVSETAVAEVAEHFRNRVAGHSGTHHRANGRRALNAILAALPSAAADSTATTQGKSVREEEVTDRPVAQPITAASFPSANIPAIDLTHKLRVAEHTWPAAGSHANQEAQSTDVSPIDEVHAEQSRIDAALRSQDEQGAVEQAGTPVDSTASLDSTDAIHQCLLSLSPIDLCRALGRVETRHAMLALCGLPNYVAEAVFEILPRAQAKQVRIKMNSLGSLHLREIDEAKEKVAHASMAANGERSSQVPLAA
jgi:flagellar motor switch protein FliG